MYTHTHTFGFSFNQFSHFPYPFLNPSLPFFHPHAFLLVVCPAYIAFSCLTSKTAFHICSSVTSSRNFPCQTHQSAINTALALSFVVRVSVSLPGWELLEDTNLILLVFVAPVPTWYLAHSICFKPAYYF